MGAYVAIMDHQYFDVSDDNGSFSIDHLPPGEYEVEAWHEKFGSQKKLIKVEAGKVNQLTFEFGGTVP
jgi:hypothetical protein